MKRVYLEITDACNLNCPFCTYEKGNTFLSLPKIIDYVSQIKPYCRYIYLHILGEPLLHPDFEKILHLLDEQQMKLQLVTNGTLLGRFPDILDHACLRKLSISLHSISDAGAYKDYFMNVDRLIEDDKGKCIELRFYGRDSLSKGLKDYLEGLDRRYGLKLSDRKDSYRLKNDVYVRFADLFRWPDIADDIIGDQGYCHGGIDMIAINSKGKVCLCCLDPHAENLLGDLNEKTLKEILESETYLNYLKDIRERRLTFDLCRRCSYRLRFR